MGAHSNPGEVAFRCASSCLILDMLLFEKAYSKGVSSFGEHTLAIFHFPTTDYVTLSLVTSEFLELLSLWPTSRPSFYKAS